MAKTARMRAAKTYLRVDTSELSELCETMRAQVSPEGFDHLMRRTLNEVGKASKKIVKESVQSEYEAPAQWIQAAIQPARIEDGMIDGLKCRIPLNGTRGSGARNKRGSIFYAGGKTSKGHIRKGDRRKVWMRDVNGVKSELPYKEEYMKGYGGQPPFINGGDFVMTRAGKERGPLRRVVGVAMPQMPLNKAEEETRRRLLAKAEERLVHNFEYMFGRRHDDGHDDD